MPIHPNKRRVESGQLILVSGINSMLVTVRNRKKNKVRCQPYPEICLDEIHHCRNRKEAEAGIERGSGRGEFMCAASKHKEKKTSKRKRLLHWARSLFSAALYSHLLFNRAASSCTHSVGGLPSHQTLLECVCVCVYVYLIFPPPLST